jgi:tetrahydromethanopterin S-methyltransferase subunit E
MSRPHQMIAGVAQQRGPGITDQRHRGTLLYTLYHAFRLLPLIVLVKGKARRAYAEMTQQHTAMPRIFGSDKRHLPQYLDRPRRHIGEIADGRSHYIKRTVYN